MKFTQLLTHLADSIAEIEGIARQLPNQNIGDIIAEAKVKIVQASQHPDAEVLERSAQGGPVDAPSEPVPSPVQQVPPVPPMPPEPPAQQ